MVTSLLMVSQSSLISPEDRTIWSNKIMRGRFILTSSNVLGHQDESTLLNANQQILSERFAKKCVIGLTLNAQMKRYHCYHHVFLLLLLLLLLCYLNFWREIQIYESEKFRIFGGKFKFEMQNTRCKMQNANVIGSALNPSFQRTCNT